MGFISNFLGRGAPTQESLQQESNQVMLRMLQERLAVSTCPTERQQIQNNINNIQRTLAQNTVQEQPNPTLPKVNFQPLEQELSSLKGSITRIESILATMKAQLRATP